MQGLAGLGDDVDGTVLSILSAVHDILAPSDSRQERRLLLSPTFLTWRILDGSDSPATLHAPTITGIQILVSNASPVPQLPELAARQRVTGTILARRLLVINQRIKQDAHDDTVLDGVCVMAHSLLQQSYLRILGCTPGAPFGNRSTLGARPRLHTPSSGS